MNWFTRKKRSIARWFKRKFSKGTTVRTPKKEVSSVSNGLVCPDQYKENYINLWESAEIIKRSLGAIGIIQVEKDKYLNAEFLTGVPWYVIAAIHNLEASQSFQKNMMNGQSLHKVTTWVPRGYGPWATWEESCVDAFKIKKLPTDWNLVNTLYFLESFNGTGYLKYHKNVNSPYLWSYTNHYTKGKYVSDGKWSSSAVSKQMGAAAIIKDLGIVLS